VPRVLNKLYDRVMGEVAQSSFKSYLLKRAIASKESDRQKYFARIRLPELFPKVETLILQRGIVRQNSMYDMLVFKQIRAQFGGNIIRAVTGSAPIAKDVYEFSRAAFSCIVSSSEF
jgi:long-chain acyl-CoA synthetase